MTVDAAETNQLNAWRLLAGRAPGGAVEETDEVLLAHLPVPVPYFNAAFVKAGVEPSSQVDVARRFYSERDMPFSILCRSTDGAELANAGFAAVAEIPLMVAEVESMASHDGLEISRVDAESWDEHLRVLSEGFGFPATVARNVFGPWWVDDDRYTALVARLDGVAASTASAVVLDGVVGIYNVATPERFRRRGLGEGVTAAAVVAGARRGCQIATLQASAMGKPIYERMGFQTVTTWTRFVPASHP